MEPFIRNDQFNFIKLQIKNLVNGHATAKHPGVINALKALTNEKVNSLFPELTEEQRKVLDPIVEIVERTDADLYLLQLKPYLLSFPQITEQTIRKMFPKVKKLKVPSIGETNLNEISYLGWNDSGSNKKYIIIQDHKEFIATQGTFKRASKKGICALCNCHEDVGMFMTLLKGSTQDTYTTRGNYICEDSQKCNNNLTNLEKLHDFIELLNE